MEKINDIWLKNSEKKIVNPGKISIKASISAIYFRVNRFKNKVARRLWQQTVWVTTWGAKPRK